MLKTSLNVGKQEQYWLFVEPIQVQHLSEDYRLLLHPPTGSWAIVATDQMPIVEVLVDAAKRGLLNELASPEKYSLFEDFVSCGLMLKNGYTAWSSTNFNHAANPVSKLILKLVGYCNLACTYCYDYNTATYKERMTVETATEAITQAFNCAGSYLSILFHGGEPLLAFDTIQYLVPFARAKAAELNKEVSFSVQTNGTQFNQQTVSYLLAEKFSIGVSLDGPAHINDLLRVDHLGKGHHTQIEKALRNYPGFVAQVGVLTTVTSYNVKFLVEIAEYVQKLGVRRWDITLFQDAGRGQGKTDDFSPESSDIVAAYFSLLDAIEEGKFNQLEIRPILHYLRNTISYERRNMCLRNCCGASTDLVSINVNGTIEACDCIKDPALRLGSVEKGGIGAALDSSAARSIRSRSVSSLLQCQTCDWRVMCGGTCLAKAGDLNEIDEQECLISLAIFPELFRRLSLSNKLEKYAQLFP